MKSMNNNFTPEINQIKNLLKYNFIFVTLGGSYYADPDYIQEKWDRWIKFEPIVPAPGIYKTTAEYIDFYNTYWKRNDAVNYLDPRLGEKVSAYADKFGEANTRACIRHIIFKLSESSPSVSYEVFEYVFGPLHLICDEETTGEHPLIKERINDLIEDRYDVFKPLIRDLRISRLGI